MKGRRTKYNKTFVQKLHKEFCEIEGCNATPEMLHHHHIIERTEINTSNDFWNIAVLCANHHNFLHQGGKLKIIGVYPSTNRYGRKLVYELDGKKNINIDEPYTTPKPLQMKIYTKEDND